MKKIVSSVLLLLTLVTLFAVSTPFSYAAVSIANSKHNLSSTGPGDIKALEEDRICIFCHTPHHATPQTPLWNRELTEGTSYQLYDSTTFNVTLGVPTGPSRLCLSCHDGTVGLGAVLSIPGGIDMNMELTGRASLLGTDLRNDHPFSFPYSEAQPFNNELVISPPVQDLNFYNGDAIHCSTCHDPHDNSFGMFLAMDNNYSALCLKCHVVYGWPESSHATSPAKKGVVGNNPWPLNERVAPEHQRDSVEKNGCENCHVSHNAGGPERLLSYLEEEKNCLYACHNSNVTDSAKDISAQFDKFSSHPLDKATIGDGSGLYHDPTEDVSFLSGHVECQDCHDQHSVNSTTATAPSVSGRLINVKGRDKNGFIKEVAQYEYEICYKCHGDTSTATPVVNRYVNSNNTIEDFSESNPSFHPIVAMGTNSNVPSLPIHVPGTIYFDPLLSESSQIYCSDCHSSDGTSRLGGTGPNGPHGSIYSPILRERFEIGTGTSENYSTYALCYRCHDRDVILSDLSFKKNQLSEVGGHSGHIGSGNGTSCSVCHDPHGVKLDPASGDHTHLINFDTSVVSPVVGSESLMFVDGLSDFSGSCTLICHGVTHDGSATYSYP